MFDSKGFWVGYCILAVITFFAIFNGMRTSGQLGGKQFGTRGALLAGLFGGVVWPAAWVLGGIILLVGVCLPRI